MIDVRVMDTDAKYYISRPLRNVLEMQDKEKNNKKLLTFMSKLENFTPFVVSVNDILDREVRMIIQQFYWSLATKCK